MRIAILIVAVFLCGAWGRVSERFAFNSESENGIVLYASITNVDLIIRQVDLERLQTISGPIMLPATHRFNADVVRGELGALGFKELPPGFYAIVDARTDLSAQIGGGGTSGGCQDHSALVFEVRRGQIRVLPRALYRLTDNRAQGRTGLGYRPNF
jgi:hypothetical protein